jgi:S-methylmethionine-dependent homocysteine/selenocysteine methylase
MKSLLEEHDLILTEAAIVERLRRSGRVELHPTLVHAALVYDVEGRAEMERLFQGYVSIAAAAGVPIIVSAPTWRANYERVRDSGVNLDVNADAVRFLLDLREAQEAHASMLKVGGFIGCKNDCYRPEEALSTVEAERFHSWQIERLAQAGVDFLMAATLPNIDEAIGIARAMERTGVPYIISFVIGSDGRVLDGTGLWDAVQRVDASTVTQPLCYMVNCSYPAFLRAKQQPSELFTRLLGYQGNSSALSHSELDGSAQLEVEDVAEWAEEMLRLNREHGVKILGGCCGTGDAHLLRLVGADHG